MAVAADGNGRAPSGGRVASLVAAIREQDPAEVEQALIRLSRRRRFLAPLGMLVGAFVMLFDGLKLMITDWRLTVVQVLPAMWIWAALLDLKVYVFRGRTLHVAEGPLLIPIGLAIVALTIGAFFLNAVFVLAISRPGRPRLDRALREASGHLAAIAAWGAVIGSALAFTAIMVPRWGEWWFALSMSIVVGVLMLTYVAVPARMVGLERVSAGRQGVSATVVGGAIGAVVCTPPYLMGRLGILLLGSGALLAAVGAVLLLIGLTVQAGATGAVKAIKMSAKLSVSRQSDQRFASDSPARRQ